MFSRSPYLTEKDIEDVVQYYEPYRNFFDPAVFKTSTVWDGKDFYGHITSVIDGAMQYLKSKQGRNDSISVGVIPRVIGMYSEFAALFELALTGKRSLAYSHLAESIMSKLGMTFSTFRSLTRHPLSPEEDGVVYRMRLGADIFNAPFMASEMFHIPFEKRHLIGNARFSLTGFPSLYFANSVYGCWEEMGRPNIDSCFVSKFNLTGHHFIDLTRTPEDLNKSLDKWSDKNYLMRFKLDDEGSKNFEYLLTDYLLLWPIIFCSSVKVAFQQAVFKPEYIFPQLLLEWVVSDPFANYDGIKFRSTKAPMLKGLLNEDVADLMINYVVPARSFRSAGLCIESVEKIEVSNPVSYGLVKLLKPEGMPSSAPSSTGPISYSNTVFGALEKELSALKLERLVKC